MAQSRLGDVWKTLRQSKDIKDQKLVNDFQEWAQEEEVYIHKLYEIYHDNNILYNI